MGQELAEPRQSQDIKKNTQQYKVQEIWKKLPKTDFNKETDKNKKVILKGKLYTKVSDIYESEEGKPIMRHVVRRCVNSLTIKAK